MAKREILFCGEPILRKKARRIREITDETRQVVEDLKQTLIESATPAVGLAAPQIGESVRAIVVRQDATPEAEIHCLLNPRIVERDGEEESIEGCLSFPTLQGIVVRPASVVAQAMTPEGETVRIEAQGLLARALQHELDHLDGILFVDRAEPGSLGWMVPDETEESGYRIEPATLEEVIARFRRLRAGKVPG